METVPFFFRGIAIGFTILLLTWTWINHIHSKSGFYLTLTLSGVCAYLIAPIIGIIEIQHIVIFIASLIPPLFFLFTLNLFNDESLSYPSNRTIFTLICLYQFIAYTNYLGLSQTVMISPLTLNWLTYASTALKLSFLGLAFVSIIRYWRIDLVESRRLFRIWMVFFGAVYISAVVLVELNLMGNLGSLWLETLNALLIAIFLGLVSGWCVLINPAGLFVKQTRTHDEANISCPDFIENQAEPQSKHKTPAQIMLADQIVSELNVLDQNELNILKHVMLDEKAYLNENLSIGRLSELTKIPEHRLRKLINQHLGYRNYNDYLNSYRITDAAKRLADPVFARTPVLTIAFEVGFGSIAPFNRAFKTRFNTSPTAFRKLHFSVTGQKYDQNSGPNTDQN